MGNSLTPEVYNEVNIPHSATSSSMDWGSQLVRGLTQHTPPKRGIVDDPELARLLTQPVLQSTGPVNPTAVVEHQKRRFDDMLLRHQQEVENRRLLRQELQAFDSDISSRRAASPLFGNTTMSKPPVYPPSPHPAEAGAVPFTGRSGGSTYRTYRTGHSTQRSHSHTARSSSSTSSRAPSGRRSRSTTPVSTRTPSHTPPVPRHRKSPTQDTSEVLNREATEHEVRLRQRQRERRMKERVKHEILQRNEKERSRMERQERVQQLESERRFHLELLRRKNTERRRLAQEVALKEEELRKEHETHRMQTLMLYQQQKFAAAPMRSNKRERIGSRTPSPKPGSRPNRSRSRTPPPAGIGLPPRRSLPRKFDIIEAPHPTRHSPPSGRKRGKRGGGVQQQQQQQPQGQQVGPPIHAVELPPHGKTIRGGGKAAKRAAAELEEQRRQKEREEEARRQHILRQEEDLIEYTANAATEATLRQPDLSSYVHPDQDSPSTMSRKVKNELWDFYKDEEARSGDPIAADEQEHSPEQNEFEDRSSKYSSSSSSSASTSSSSAKSTTPPEDTSSGERGKAGIITQHQMDKMYQKGRAVRDQLEEHSPAHTNSSSRGSSGRGSKPPLSPDSSPWEGGEWQDNHHHTTLPQQHQRQPGSAGGSSRGSSHSSPQLLLQDNTPQQDQYQSIESPKSDPSGTSKTSAFATADTSTVAYEHLLKRRYQQQAANSIEGIDTRDKRVADRKHKSPSTGSSRSSSRKCSPALSEGSNKSGGNVSTGSHHSSNSRSGRHTYVADDPNDVYQPSMDDDLRQIEQLTARLASEQPTTEADMPGYYSKDPRTQQASRALLGTLTREKKMQEVRGRMREQEKTKERIVSTSERNRITKENEIIAQKMKQEKMKYRSGDSDGSTPERTHRSQNSGRSSQSTARGGFRVEMGGVCKSGGSLRLTLSNPSASYTVKWCSGDRERVDVVGIDYALADEDIGNHITATVTAFDEQKQPVDKICVRSKLIQDHAAPDIEGDIGGW